MNKKTARIYIKLKSDLCTGSGYSYEETVDNDVCYNENGIPYIPGRRIKGCLKEAAEAIRLPASEINELFGSGGNRNEQKIFIGNAYPAGYKKLNEELSILKKCGKYKNDLSVQRILNRFTHIRANTSIDQLTGTADENTLRFTRVVNQYHAAGSKEEMTFVSDILFEYNEKILERIVKSLRHMGLSRNRGLGNVSCCMEHVKLLPETGTVPDCTKDQTPARLNYQIVNIQPLMMSAVNDSCSEKYIAGQNVLGALAGIYLEKKKEHTADGDDLFADLFLNGNVCYSNLYISDKIQDGGEMTSYVPVPFFLNELKKTKEIVNTAKPYGGSHYGTDGRLDAGNGNQPRKLKDKYAAVMKDGRSIRILEPETDIEFHHTNKKSYASDSSEDGQLYAFTVLRQGQYFSGSIYGKKCHLEILKWLLDHGTLRLGKSKTAQYGLCSVSSLQIQDETENDSAADGKENCAAAGEEILAILESNGTFLIPGLGYTDRYDKVLQQIAEDLKISYEIPDNAHSSIQTCTVSGYHTLWNLKKHSLPAIRAGSVFHYRLTKDARIKTTSWAGVKNHEGFGRIRIYRCSKLPEEYELITPETVLDEDNPVKPEYCKDLLIDILYEELSDILNEAVFLKPSLNISASALGRITLMLKESGGDFKDFAKRINSISREKELEKIRDFINQHIGYIHDGKEDADVKDAVDVKKMLFMAHSADQEQIQEICGKLSELENWNGPLPEEENRIEAMWSSYLLQIFQNEKYRLKEKVNEPE